MNDTEFDQALIASAFQQAAVRGWRDLSLADAARDAGLPLARARARFPGRAALLLRFGALADQAALGDVASEAEPRERLFDLLMQRFDALQAHRDGIVALLHAVPSDPAAASLLYGATLRSMAWLLDAAGVPTSGVLGALRVHGLLAIWLSGLRAWERDVSADLSGTMAAVDRGLDQAVRAEGWWPGRNAAGSPPAPEASERRMAAALAQAPIQDLTAPEPNLPPPEVL